MGFFKIFYLCFCSILPYEEVAFRWRWKALTYFFALCLISFCGTFIGTRGFVEKVCRDIIEPISKQMELIKVKDGKIDLESPVELKSSNGAVLGLVSSEYLDARQARDLLFAAEKDRFSIYFAEGSEFSIPFSDLNLVNGPLSEGFMGTDSFVNVVYPLFILAATFSMNIFYLAILSLATFILSFAHVPNFGYARSIRLTLVAMTPAILFNFLLLIFGGEELPSYVFTILSMAIVYFVLRKFQRSEIQDY